MEYKKQDFYRIDKIHIKRKIQAARMCINIVKRMWLAALPLDIKYAKYKGPMTGNAIETMKYKKKPKQPSPFVRTDANIRTNIA